ncbi:SDR family NAD(P)-dependent oxidoreductase [Arthrobacter sp. H14-L1]|uniref:SDR family NAD(P)-dependent oxidoreductase n=1 Tax=Arthrobacter sp. H14-L1 TaxID=2996697 RepID=UPI002270E403|nr:SDR family NAD(P)-dependent oxidoreductase [Arthrobacter sp. H14-L1]MCY0905226.1 SDR family NAD(P)-dependent oxidoreductase [Arthrobacter sp. H14-L1]
MGVLMGRVALVTGSSRGIGSAIATEFAAEGAAVAVHGRDEAATAAVRDRIIAAGGRAVMVLGDVTSPEVVDRISTEIGSALGPLDVLVANAGGNPTRPGPLERMSLDEWRAAVDANLTATFVTIAAILPGMKQRGRGSIVTLSSAASRRPTPQSPVAYAAAKAGIEVLTKWLAAEAGPSGVRVNCIAPETIMTERNEQMIPAEVQERLAQTHPLRRLGSPQDVARAAVYLASDQAEWVTGIILDIAGGAVLK